MITGNMILVILKFPLELILAEALFLPGMKKRPLWKLRAALFLICFFALSTLIFRRGPSFGSPGIDSIISVCRYMIVCLLSGFGIFLCFESSVYQTVLAVIGGYSVQHAAYSAHNLLSIIINAAFGISLSRTAASLFLSSLPVYLVVYAALYLCFIRRINRSPESIRLGSLIPLAAVILMNVLIFDGLTQYLTRLQNILFRVMNCFNCTAMLALLAGLSENLQLRRDIKLIDQLSAMNDSRYQMLQEHIELTNMKCHDFKHQIIELRRQNQEGTRPVKAVLDEMEQAIDIYDAICKTGNEALDTVLTEKSLLCQHKRIQLNYMADGESLLFLGRRNIHTLFGNLLDNAIEAVESLPEDRRIIHLQIVRKGPFLTIHSSNYFDASLKWEDDLPQTTKGSSFDHGYGLKSIQRIVEAHQGQLKLSAQNGIFHVDIVIPVLDD